MIKTTYETTVLSGKFTAYPVKIVANTDKSPSPDIDWTKNAKATADYHGK